MLVREFGILIEKLGCRDQVPGDPVRVLLAERLQFGAGALVEVARLDALGNLRGIVVRPDGEIRGTVALARCIIGARARAVVASPVAIGLPVAVTDADACVTVTVRLAVTVAVGPAVTVTVRLPVAIGLAVTRLRPAVTVTVRLAVTVGLAVTGLRPAVTVTVGLAVAWLASRLSRSPYGLRSP